MCVPAPLYVTHSHSFIAAKPPLRPPQMNCVELKATINSTWHFTAQLSVIIQSPQGLFENGRIKCANLRPPVPVPTPPPPKLTMFGVTVPSSGWYSVGFVHCFCLQIVPTDFFSRSHWNTSPTVFASVSLKQKKTFNPPSSTIIIRSFPFRLSGRLLLLQAIV